MLEKSIEKKLMDETRQRSGLCLKFVSPGLVGVPDRILLMPFGKIGFVEVKRPGQIPRKMQERRIEQIRALGFQVHVLDRFDDVGRIIDEIQGA